MKTHTTAETHTMVGACCPPNLGNHSGGSGVSPSLDCSSDCSGRARGSVLRLLWRLEEERQLGRGPAWDPWRRAGQNCRVPDLVRGQGWRPPVWRRWWLRTKEEGTSCGAAPSDGRGYLAQSLAGTAAGRAPAAAGSGGATDCEDERTPRRSGCSRAPWRFALVGLKKKKVLLANRGKVCGWRRSCAAAVEPPCRCWGDDLNPSSGAGTGSRCRRGAGRVARTVKTFPV